MSSIAIVALSWTLGAAGGLADSSASDLTGGVDCPRCPPVTRPIASLSTTTHQQCPAATHIRDQQWSLQAAVPTTSART